MEETAIMIEIPELIVVLSSEAIVALVGALILMLYQASRKHRSDRSEAAALVDRINREDKAHERQLAEALSETAGMLDENLRNDTLTEVLNKEKALYRQAIQAFLSRDPAKLAEIDRHVRGISEPYCRLISQLLQQAPGSGQAGETADLEAELMEAKAEVIEAKQQLAAALEALDDVSKEYARMFGSRHTANEVSESLGRVLTIFKRAAGLVEAQPQPTQDEAEPETPP